MGTASPTTHNASPALGDRQCTDCKVSQMFAGTFSCKSRLGCAWCYCHPRVDGNHCLLQLLWRRMLGTRLARTLDARPVHQHANSRLSSGGKRSKALLLPARSLRTVGLADPQSPNGPRINQAIEQSSANALLLLLLLLEALSNSAAIASRSNGGVSVAFG